MKDKILVTGGTGLLGSHLLFDLVKEGKNVKAFKRPTSNLDEVKRIFSYYSDNSEELFSAIDWVDADILLHESIDAAMKDVYRVYHVAAMVSFNPRDKHKLVYNNVEGTANIVNACLEHDVEKVCHVSSTSALGASTNGEAVTEDLMWTPDKMNTGYSISKFKSEMEVWRGIEEGLNAVIVNPSIILGPGFWEKGSSAMFTTIQKGLAFYTPGKTGYVGVWDVVGCMRKLMDSNISGERFIINAENLHYKEIFTMIAAALEKKPPYIQVSRLLGSLAWRLDAFRSFFGYKRLITRETIMAGQNITSFSNEKITNTIQTDFNSIEEVIHDVVKRM